MKKTIGLLSFLLIFSTGLIAQEETQQHEANKNHSISFLVSHAYISQGKIDGERKFLAAPAIGINYNYKISEKWSIGLHNDIIIESFLIENSLESEETLEREYPISNLLVGTYKITEAWGLALGAGIEWEKNENFGVIRVGTEYGLEINESGLEVVFSINYDALIDAYDSLNFGIGINKFFN